MLGVDLGGRERLYLVDDVETGIFSGYVEMADVTKYTAPCPTCPGTLHGYPNFGHKVFCLLRCDMCGAIRTPPVQGYRSELLRYETNRRMIE